MAAKCVLAMSISPAMPSQPLCAADDMEQEWREILHRTAPHARVPVRTVIDELPTPVSDGDDNNDEGEDGSSSSEEAEDADSHLEDTCMDDMLLSSPDHLPTAPLSGPSSDELADLFGDFGAVSVTDDSATALGVVEDAAIDADAADLMEMWGM